MRWKIIDPSKLPAHEEPMESVRLLKKLPSMAIITIIDNILVIPSSIVRIFSLTSPAKNITELTLICILDPVHNRLLQH